MHNGIMSIILLTFASYGLYNAIQMLRKDKLNFKPFNCALCTGFWFGLLYVVCFKLSIINLVTIPFFTGGTTYLLGIIEGRLISYKETDNGI